MRANKKLLKVVPPIDIETLNGHRPKKVFESNQAIIFDDFLPEDIYQRVSHFARKMDYEHINTKGKISRAWHIHDGFPLRSLLDLIYFADQSNKPKEGYVYPTNGDLDLFTDHLLAIQPAVEGGWHDDEADRLVWERPVLVYAHVHPERFASKLEVLRSFLHRLGRESRQGEVAVEFDGQFFRIREFDES